MARKRQTEAGALPGPGMPYPSGHARCQGGFSIYELLFVVIILSLAATVLIPSKGPGDSIKLDLAAMEIADAFRFARSESLRLGTPHGASLDEKIARVQLFSLDLQQLPPTPAYNVYHPVDKQLYDRHLGKAPFDFTGRISLSPEFRGTCDAMQNIYFNADGIPWCTDPAVVLLDGYKIALLLGDDLRTVLVHGITGRVTIE